jgi:hypothetical protein
MGAESRLLYDERPLVLIPELARLLKKEKGFSGIDEALVLQQVHYWVVTNQRANRNEQDGFFWTYNSFKAWAEQFAYLWSESTLKRIFARLEKAGYLVSGRFNKSNIDRTKWYRVNYEALNRLCQNEPSIVSNWPNGTGQVDPMDSVKLTPSGQARRTHEKPAPESNQSKTPESNNKEVSSSSKKPRIPKLHSRPIFAEMQKVFGYPETTDKDPIPNYGKEAKAIDRMTKRGYSEADILAAWKKKVKARGEFVSMVFVNEDIGKPDRTDRPRQAAFALPGEEDLVAQAKERGLN